MDYDAEDVAAVFGRAADTYDTIVPFFVRFGGRLIELADLHPGETVLDVGAGRGATLIPAARRVGPGGRVVGVDLSTQMVDLLGAEVEQLGLANASVRRMDAEALDVEPESFDVALASFVFHIFCRPDLAAMGVERALRPGGRIAASAPLPVGSQWDFLVPLFRTFGPRVLRPVPMPFRPDFDLDGLLRSAGLHVVLGVEEELQFVFVDEQAWWDWSWSAGMRALFESLSPSDLELLREQAFAGVASLRTPDGISLRQTARFVVAEKCGPQPKKFAWRVDPGDRRS